jgi:hypothetical protein
MRAVRAIGVGAGTALAVMGAALGVLAIVALIGGGIYRTVCIGSTGQRITSWSAEGDVPYFWSPGSGCEAHTLTRFVLGKVGILSDISTDTIYTPSLISDVASGSLALERIAGALNPQAIAAANPSRTASDRAAGLLISGQLRSLHESDLRTVAALNLASENRLRQFVQKLRSIRSEIAASEVDPAQYTSLSGGAKAFIAAWNTYLTANTGRLALVLSALSRLRPVYGETTALIAAAGAALHGGSRTGFDIARLKVLHDIVRRADGFKAELAPVLTGTAPERNFAGRVSSSADARAIIAAVNRQEPTGWLATQRARA